MIKKLLEYKKTLYILLIIIVIFSISRIYIKLHKNIKYIIRYPKSGKTRVILSKNNLLKFKKNYGINWSINFWIYIDDWQYKYGYKKYIIKSGYCNIWLDNKNNNLMIQIPTYNNKNGETLIYKKIKIQKWLNICIILENRNLDLWINSKLYHSRYLTNIPKINNNNFIVTPDGGFSGFISRLKYFNYNLPLNSLIIYNSINNIYNNGPFPLIYKIPFLSTIYKKLKSNHLSIKINVDK